MTPETQNFGSSALDFPPIFSMYIQDPYSGSILNPQDCWIEFPTWPSEVPEFPRQKNKNRNSDKFYIPAIPPYRPYENDKPLNKTIADWFKSSAKEYFSKTKDGLKFRLELAGFSKDEISVAVEEGKYLKVNSKSGQKPYSKGFVVPDAENYNLSNPTAKMENGLLEISFAAKKEEVRAIKIL